MVEDTASTNGSEPTAATIDAVARPLLAVVGNGMVGHHFCEEAVRRGLHERFRIEVYGEETQPAYDRVNLSKVIEGSSLETLRLRSSSESSESRRRTHVGVRVEAIHPGDRELRLSDGRVVRYAQLVLATGSRARRPDIAGADLDDVFVYRTAADAKRLRERAMATVGEEAPVLVIGGGLLGLELAETLRSLGPRVTVVENSSSLLPKQLDPDAGRVLQSRLESQRLSFRLDLRIREIRRSDDGGLLACFEGQAAPLRAAWVVFAIGVVPRDELARSAKLHCDLFGGIEVDGGMRTSDPNVYAIGECARFRGMTYGLVAPGYRMADVAVDRLLGGESRFEGAELAVRLKTRAADVMTVGESASHGIDVHAVVYRNGDDYRRLTVRGGKVVGATTIGAWDQLPAAQQAVAKALPLRRWEERRFLRNRPIWGGESLALQAWPDTATVCGCTGVTCGALRAALESGCRTPDALVDRTGAGGHCGSCRPLLDALCNPQATVGRPAAARWLLAASLAAALAVLAVLTLGPIPYADSIQRTSLDVLWRDTFVKQVTGYTLAALMATGLIFSLRKHWRAFSWAPFANWRAVHSGVGLLTVLGTIVHTGLRLGANLDAMLMGAFLACTVVGAAAGGVAALEARLPPGSGAEWRQRLNRIHLYLAWPLPLLVLFHALKFYYF